MDRQGAGIDATEVETQGLAFYPPLQPGSSPASVGHGMDQCFATEQGKKELRESQKKHECCEWTRQDGPCPKGIIHVRSQPHLSPLPQTLTAECV